MLEFYLDTADVSQVARFNACLPIRGVTTNPSILAKCKLGVRQLLPELVDILGPEARFHVQAVSQTVDDIVAEARQIAALPYDVVVKIPATEIGLAAIKKLHAEQIPVLATAIYTAHQGFLAALNGADYLAPYINRIDVMGNDGIKVAADIQLLLDQHQLHSQLLPASFKNTQQVLDVLKIGVSAITLPTELVAQMFAHPAVEPAVQQFRQDWQSAFGAKLAFEV